MEKTLSFLTDLKLNNNREWFEQNRQRYKEVQEEFNSFTEKLIDGITLFDPSVKGVSVKECTYRIYRDLRFSPNKEPYKEHIGAYICPQGKKSGYAGYYFHIEPNNSILAVGLHCPEPKILKSVREEIYDNGDEFQKAIELAKGFEVDTTNSLKRTPKGYPSDTKYDEYLRLKNYDLIKPITLQDNLLDYCIEEFRQCVRINNILNKAVKYAMEI